MQLKVLLIATYMSSIFSCNTDQKDITKTINGTWSIIEFEHMLILEEKNKILNLRKEERFYSIGFSDNNHIWFTRVKNREDEIIRAKYQIFNHGDSFKINIEKSDDPRIIGQYDMYIDTIGETEKFYKVQISFDSENTYLSAVRMKSK